MSDDGEIVVLKGLEPVRRRPGIGIGGTDREGLYRLLWEVVGNVVDQHLARSATELRVEIDGDAWVTVVDDGPGISVDYNPIEEKTVLEVVLSTLHCGGTRGGHFPTCTSGSRWPAWARGRQRAVGAFRSRDDA